MSEEMTPEMPRPTSPTPQTKIGPATDRRSFITAGGAAIALSAFLVSCSRKDKELIETGSMPKPADVTTTTAPGDADMDITLLRTLQSIELLASDTYATLLSSGLITTTAVTTAFEAFKAHHEEHAGMVAKWVTKAGGEPYDKANEYIKTQTIDPAAEALAAEADVLALAVEVENIAAQTYALAGGSLTTPALRQSAMSIGPSEARHMSVIYGLLATPQVPLPEMPTRDAAPKRALLPGATSVIPDEKAESGKAETKATTTTKP